VWRRSCLTFAGNYRVRRHDIWLALLGTSLDK
jgi:hypothetical protein